MKHIVYVGQYSGGETCGVRTLAVDGDTGEIEPIAFVDGLQSTLWLALSPDGSRLYSSRERGVVAFDVKGEGLVAVADYEIGHTHPCHFSLSADGKRLAFAEYAEAVCGVIDLSTGRVTDRTLVGGGPNLPRQDKAHAHCAVETPDGRHLCVVDLGSDAIWLFDPITFAPHGKLGTDPVGNKGTDPADKGTGPSNMGTGPGGEGPRHLIFHQNGRFAYVIFELANIVAAYRYVNGVFIHLQTLPLLPSDFTGHSQAAALKLSADGRRLFATNRGHDSVVTFDVDPDTGMMSFRACSPLGGSWPRDFTMLPGERIALACLERAGEVRSFRYDAATGAFSPLPYAFRTHRPVVAVLNALAHGA